MKIITACVFIDWNSQIHACKPSVDLLAEAERTLRYVSRSISKVLAEADSSTRFLVSLRFYHGWHKGFEATDRRKALIMVSAGAEFGTISDRANVIIRPAIEFGDNLLSALQSRMHVRLNCHLPNTLRQSIARCGSLEEKMVDTAIASDLVDTAHRERDTWLVVVGEDDDLVPPVLVAEGVRGGTGGRVILVRRRPNGPFLKLDALRSSP